VKTRARLLGCLFCRFGTALDEFTAPVWQVRGGGLADCSCTNMERPNAY